MILQPPKQGGYPTRIEISSIGINLDDNYCDMLDSICWQNDIDVKVEFFIKKKKPWDFNFVSDIYINGTHKFISSDDVNILKDKVKEEIKKTIKIWYAVSKHGTEYFFARKPKRGLLKSWGDWVSDKESRIEQLPKGTIEKITGIKMTWFDEPIAVIRSEVKNQKTN